MLIEGKNAIAEVLGNPSITIEKILIAKNTTDNAFISKIKNSGHKYQFVEKAALDKLSQTRNHQGFIAFTSDYKYHDLDQIFSLLKNKENGTILILDGVEDPHNLGNIVRTAECMGVDAIIIPKNRSAQVNETVTRVSMGAISHMRVCKVTNINQTIETLKQNNFWIYASDMNGKNVSKINLKGRVGIVMGGEDTGVSQLTKKISDEVITIPMHGKTNSLNVANATAMILYEIQRQRSF
ncbi:MAG: 23S rRNA (guanosine(2251)-2'-O)-methyltransferase RlmB [Firmicutes bacterium]|nr:23S rRNA (guanosine(2251)-2'-O)-methyltransferase RlmB [Bacillota bacterium]